MRSGVFHAALRRLFRPARRLTKLENNVVGLAAYRRIDGVHATVGACEFGEEPRVIATAGDEVGDAGAGLDVDEGQYLRRFSRGVLFFVGLGARVIGDGGVDARGGVRRGQREETEKQAGGDEGGIT